MTAELDLSEFRATDREECGILVGVMRDGKRLATRVVKVHNYAEGPNDYGIGAPDFERVIRELGDGEHVIGFLHTHLPHHKPMPSAMDFLGARIIPDFINLVYKPSTGEMCWYSSSRIESGL